MEQNNPLRKIPNCITKAELVKIYRPVPEKLVLEIVNEKIIINRKKIKKFKDRTPEQLKKTIYVFKEEFLALIKEIGIPDGYEK